MRSGRWVYTYNLYAQDFASTRNSMFPRIYFKIKRVNTSLKLETAVKYVRKKVAGSMSRNAQ